MSQLRFVDASSGGEEIALPQSDGPLFVVAAAAPARIQVTAQRPRSFLAALLHVGGHWLVLSPLSGGYLAIDGVEVPWLRILDDQSVLAVGGWQLRLTERTTEVLRADSPLIRQGRACPVCLLPFGDGALAWVCPVCGVAHHADCVRQYKRCASEPFCGYILPAASGQDHETPTS